MVVCLPVRFCRLANQYYESKETASRPIFECRQGNDKNLCECLSHSRPVAGIGRASGEARKRPRPERAALRRVNVISRFDLPLITQADGLSAPVEIRPVTRGLLTLRKMPKSSQQSWCRPGCGFRASPVSVREITCGELGSFCRKTDLDVAQAFPVGELGEGHDPKLFGTSHGTNALVAAEPSKVSVVSVKCRPRQKTHQLSKQCLASIHDRALQKNPKGFFADFKSTLCFIARKARSVMAFGGSGAHLTGQQWQKI